MSSADVARIEAESWNLRTRAASLCVLLGLAGAMSVISWGGDGGLRLPSNLACAAGGICGICFHFSRRHPSAARWLLTGAISLTALGLTGLAIAASTHPSPI